MLEFENYATKGWWWYVQLLIAEKKCTAFTKEYNDYCHEFIKFLQTWEDKDRALRKKGGYGAG